jgi:Lon-like ATP-dependent protease
MVNGLALTGNVGQVIEIEVSVLEANLSEGKFKVTGIIEAEEIEGGGRVFKRQSMAVSAGQNVLTVLRRLGICPEHFDIHVNFPGGVPVDGPSAGISMAVAIYSAITNTPVDHQVAMTGEITVLGKIKPVGGIMAKVDAARRAGLKKVIIPADNWLHIFDHYTDIDIIPVSEFTVGLEAALSSASHDLVRIVN